MSDLDYDELQRLADAATPGPWAAGEPEVWEDTLQSSVDASGVPITWDDHSGEVFKPEDAEFIAAARSAVPALLDRVREAEAERDDLESRLSDFLCEVTGGLLSKTGYDARTMIQHADEYYERRAKEDHDEHCDKAESFEAERDAAVVAIERVRAVHRKETRLNNWEVCTHCAVGMLQDPVDWPCDTIAALEGGVSGE